MDGSLVDVGYQMNVIAQKIKLIQKASVAIKSSQKRKT